jgi:predicted amidohydrolase YtcJ
VSSSACAATRLEYLTGLGLRSDFGDDRLRIGGVKFSIDGSASFRNAAVNKEYSNSSSGLPRVRPLSALRAPLSRRDHRS